MYMRRSRCRWLRYHTRGCRCRRRFRFVIKGKNRRVSISDRWSTWSCVWYQVLFLVDYIFVLRSRSVQSMRRRTGVSCMIPRCGYLSTSIERIVLNFSLKSVLLTRLIYGNSVYLSRISVSTPNAISSVSTPAEDGESHAVWRSVTVSSIVTWFV